MSDRTAKKYNQLIGRIDNSYYFLDEIFKYSDDFQGATATVIEPVGRGEYDEQTSDENIREYLRDHWQMQVSDGSTEQSLDEYVDEVTSYENVEDIVFSDIIDDDRTEDLRKRLAASVDDYPVFIASGGGRSFSKGMQWDFIYNQELLDEIEKVEK